MARRPSQPQPELPILLAISHDDAGSQIEAQIKKGESLRTRPIISEEELTIVESAFARWSDYNREMFRHMFTTTRIAEEYAGMFAGLPYGERLFAEEVEFVHKRIDEKINRLTSIKERLGLFKTVHSIPQEKPERPPTSNNKVFVVHGHDDGACQTVARYISALGLDPIILHEQPSQGRTIVEKLEHHGDVSYAVVILTPDDVGGESPDKLQPRARQNVVMELGYFMGRLERKCVCALYKSGVVLPSNYLGVVYVPFDEGDGWRLRLARELKAAGLKVDMNAAL